MTRTLDEVRLLRPAEAAAVLGVSVRQLDRLVEAGRLQPVRLTENGSRRLRVRDLDALVNPTKETTT